MLAKFWSEVIPTIHLAIYVVVIASEEVCWVLKATTT